MSDEDRDVDIESDEEEDEQESTTQAPLDKRAHHNALERKRRDHIKDSFTNLRDSVPIVQGEKVSRAQILKKAADYITQLRDKNTIHQKDIDSMKRANNNIVNQIRLLEKYTETAKYTEATCTRQQAKLQGAGRMSESSEEDDQPSRKKIKTVRDS